MNDSVTPQHSVTGLQQDVNQFLHWLQTQNYQFITISPDSHSAYLERRNKTHALSKTHAPSEMQASNLRDIFGWSLPFTHDAQDTQNLLPDFIFKLLQAHDLVYCQQELWFSRIRVSSLNRYLFIHSAYPTSDENAVFFGPDTYRFIYALQNHLKSYASQDQALHNKVLNNKAPIKRAVEICSGAAPAAITLANFAPQAEIFAADINPLALKYSQLNAEFNCINNLKDNQAKNAASNVQAVHSNLLNQISGEFDLITANPPYLVDDKKRVYRHGGSLLGAELALDIVKQSLPRLSASGTLLLYTGVVIVQGQDLLLEAVQQHLNTLDTAFNFDYQQIDADIFAEELETLNYPNAERIAAVVLTISRQSCAV